MANPRSYSRPGFPAAPTAALAPRREKDNESWMISYVDIVTLLLTLFVLLLASAKLTPAPHDAAETVTAAATVPTSTTKQSPPLAPPAPANDQKPDVRPASRPDRTTPSEAGTGTGDEPPAAPIDSLMTDATARLGDRARISGGGGSINLELQDTVLFAAASADLTPDGRTVLSHVADLLMRHDYPVSVEGHTDNLPIKTLRFASNWELSSARASNVTRYLIEHGVVAGRLRSIGYADTHPVTSNDTAAERSRNRRVSLVIHVSDGEKTTPNPFTTD